MENRNARVGVGVFVFKNNKFLMGKRLNAHGHETWSVPGGHLEYGESFEETARREINEEVNLEIKNVRFGAVTNDYFETEDKHYVTIWMLSDYAGGEEKINEPDKFVELSWRDFDELPDNLFLPWRQLLKSEFIENIKNQIKK